MGFRYHCSPKTRSQALEETGMTGRSAEKNARLAAALRANLKRRKAKMRALGGGGKSAEGTGEAGIEESQKKGSARPNPAARNT
jgi:hypothetical protein